MDNFVRDKLTEWGLRECIETFKDNKIGEESLYRLSDQDINDLIPVVGSRTIFREELKLLKARQSAGGTTDKEKKTQGKRKSDFHGESSGSQSQTSKRPHLTTPEANTDETILSDVKNIMKNVEEKISDQDSNKFNDFLQTKIRALDTDKREQVGVFGKTGAGKSSLINTVIGEKNLLPTGSIKACTSVMIKVEANTDSQYEAHIEFITTEDWKEELSLYKFIRDEVPAEEHEGENVYHEIVAKLSALYGEEYKKKSPENLMDKRYFKEIKEFLESKPKILKRNTAEELSAEIFKYTKSSTIRQSKEGNKWYWPLVKCVTVKVPNNEYLKHVTLVDLPGNGDRNKSRDEMWKEVVGSCSTVWIVAERNRAAAEKEAWEILERASHLMGNGGECQQIHFICTKSDHTEKTKNCSRAEIHDRIIQQNADAKAEVEEAFEQSTEIRKHFSGQSMTVFTVSSQEFFERENLEEEETEIPELRNFLQSLNNQHSETLNYVSGAYGILSLIEGASRTDLADKKPNLCTNLEKKMRDQLANIKRPIEEAYKVFEECLRKGVENSVKSCVADLKTDLFPDNPDGRGFHKTLRSVVVNNGNFTSKKGVTINLNGRLASHLTSSIDEEFKKTFPNDRRCEPFNGIISKFSLEPKKLIQEYKDVELQLIFLETEEEQVKLKLNKIIRNEKKTIYRSLVNIIKETMQGCYEKAARKKGKDSLKRMRDTLETYVEDSNETIFEKAKEGMLKELQSLKEKILETLETTMQESIDLSLKTDGNLIPGFSDEFKTVRRYHIDLNMNQDEKTAVCTNSPGQLTQHLF